MVQDFPRRCVFAGSTNDDMFLKDETGGRRFWPVKVGKIDTVMIEKHRDQMWAEAVYRFKKGEPWWITDDDMEKLACEVQEEVREKDHWEEEIMNYICTDRKEIGMKWDFMFSGGRRKYIAVSEAFEVLKIDMKDQSRYTNKINTVMRSLGLVKKGARLEYHRKKFSVYEIPDSLIPSSTSQLPLDSSDPYEY
jgi:predicted P-loop ATPase